MEFEAALQQYLITFPGLTAIVGTRVYPLTMPQNTTYPALTYQRVSERTIQSHQGTSNFAYTRYRFMCWAKTFPAARQLASALKGAIIGYRGAMGARWAGSIRHDNELDNYDEQTKTFSVLSDFIIGHNEPL